MTVGSLPTYALVVILAGSAAIVWLCGATLSRTTDTLAARFGLGEALGGLLLLAVATNLPEFAIVVSAALRGNMSMAIGNLLGGVAAQTLVLVAIDRWGVRTGAPLMTQAATPALQIEAILVIAILTLVVVGTQLAPSTALGPLTAGDALLPAAWLAGVLIIARARPTQAAARTVSAGAFGPAALAFAGASLATMAGGVGLEVAGDALADRLGVSGVLFGATVLAAATSLPELSTGIAAARSGEREMAVSDILGGNAVLPVMLVIATVLAGRSSFAQVDPTSLLLCGIGSVMTAVCAAAMVVGGKLRPRVLGFGLDGAALIGVYALGMAGVAALGGS